jgi:hypothetical protein
MTERRLQPAAGMATAPLPTKVGVPNEGFMESFNLQNQTRIAVMNQAWVRGMFVKGMSLIPLTIIPLTITFMERVAGDRVRGSRIIQRPQHYLNWSNTAAECGAEANFTRHSPQD